MSSQLELRKKLEDLQTVDQFRHPLSSVKSVRCLNVCARRLTRPAAPRNRSDSCRGL